MASTASARSSPSDGGGNNNNSKLQKARRKEPHPVRREFIEVGPNRHRCVHCDWSTVMNATRMIKHIIEVCGNCPDDLREEMLVLQQAAVEKEQNSSMLSENKKDIHGLFNVVENNKRSCMFCEWSTVRNLTRMRTHIVMHCPNVPDKVRSCFLKQEYKDDRNGSQNEETYQVFEVEDPERGGWVASTTVEFVNEADDDDNEDDEDEHDQQINYVEVQELEERQCSWCGSIISYDTNEVEDGSEVYCSQECFKSQTECMPDDEVVTVKRVTKRAAPATPSPAPEPKAKQIKVVMVTSGAAPSPKTSTVQPKKEPEVTPARPTRRSNPSQPAAPPKQSQKQPKETVEEEVVKPSRVASKPPSPQKKVVAAAELAPKAKSQPPAKVVEAAATTTTTPKKSVPTQTTTAATASKSTETATTAVPVKISVTKSAAASGQLDEGSCHSFAGGHVYPQEDVRSADHKLQWTKAVISRPAPQFEATAVVDGAFKKIKLSDYRGKYLVFFFYPLDFTFVCPTEILAFSDRVSEFKKLNAEVIAASIDSHFTHLAWINTPRKEGGLGKINIPLVSDITHSIAKDYGVYLDDLGHTLRGLFIIDDRGILRQITMNDLPVGRSVDETLRLVQAFQYTDKHGEVCPAGWKPGQDTIVPNPEEKIKYFEKNH
uniref:thioredoxin-dependent peroxiredoxin n=1 Tax=Culex tarsalis TaxID=7177 RepID=A0A1Q3F7E1_CULTA